MGIGHFLTVFLSYNFLNYIMSLDELKDKHAGSVETASEAFHELCAMVEALEAEREERREVVQTRVQTLRGMNSSSSSDSDDGDDNCSIMWSYQVLKNIVDFPF